MPHAFRLLPFLLPALAACAGMPALDGPDSPFPDAPGAGWPELIELDPMLLEARQIPTAETAEIARLARRAARLRRRARALERPVIEPAARLRMQAALARHMLQRPGALQQGGEAATDAGAESSRTEKQP